MAVPHVLIVGVDGVRWDTLAEVDTPHLDRLAASGFLVPVTVDPAGPTISGPSWTTMVTGTLATTHQVMDNDFTRARLDDCPDVLELARRRHPGIATFVGADWEPLVTDDAGGPLFAGGGLLPTRRRDGEATEVDVAEADTEVIEAAIAHVTAVGEAGSCAFVYQHGPDAVGHGLGVGEVYRETITAVDERLGALIAAVDARPDRAAEEWLIIVTTDHGHVDEGGHGGDSREERTAWIAATGAGLPALPVTRAEQVDVAGHVAAVLDLPQGPGFVGLPFGARSTDQV